MRKPDTIECLYLDFDGFFASVEQQAKPHLRGKPIGIVPFNNTEYTSVIACSREAKARGCKNVMPVREARAKCPDIILVPQSPDLYCRANDTLIAEISAVIPIDAIKSIDELTCKLDADQIRKPEVVSGQIKDRLLRYVGPYITCSIGFAANRQLAKIAGKQDKPNGTTIWHPHMVPKVLNEIPFSDIPGIGSRMEKRLYRAGVFDMETLLKLQPKHMRKLWRSVTGERLWYALHGYDIRAQKSDRGMFGHGRVLPPEARSIKDAYTVARMLTIKAARRMRKAGYYTSRFFLWCWFRNDTYSNSLSLPIVHDDQACLKGLERLWCLMAQVVPKNSRIIRLGVTFGDLSLGGVRQLDMLLDDDVERQKWERVTNAVDSLNQRYSKSLVTLGPWTPPAGGNIGGKISFTRKPKSEDFW